MKPTYILLLSALAPGVVVAQKRPAARPPIIDMHLHANPADLFGPPPARSCSAVSGWRGHDPQRDSLGGFQICAGSTIWLTPLSDEEVMRRTLAIMERYNVVGVTSGPIHLVRRWRAAAPARIIPAVVMYRAEYPLDSVRAWAADGTIRVLGELGFQYAGLAPGDSIPEAYLALAEQLDLPVAIHMGLGPPGGAYIGSPAYRARLGNPLLLEDALRRHPKLRLYVMHAGWPLLDEMLALLYTYPQVYVDIGVFWTLPRQEFRYYLRRLVEAGFAQRVMFGSDQLIVPEALAAAIEAVESAEFLTAAQKRDIFYNNAARFLRLVESRE